MTRVVHCKKEKYDIYIGRGSKWGNPFLIGGKWSRDEVIIMYESYLLNNKPLLNSLPELKDKVLGCWCKPKACHGDILIKYVEKYEKDVYTKTFNGRIIKNGKVMPYGYIPKEEKLK